MQENKCGDKVGKKVNPLILMYMWTSKVRDWAAGEVSFEYRKSTSS